MKSKIKPGIFRHYKGKKYLVLANAKNSETLEEMVVYVSLYENPESQVWVRPAKMFFELVEYKGKKVPRFKSLSNS